MYLVLYVLIQEQRFLIGGQDIPVIKRTPINLATENR